MNETTLVDGFTDDYVKSLLTPADACDVMNIHTEEDTGMKWSNNQNNIFEWFKAAAAVPAEPRRLVVEAVAGSGKTTLRTSPLTTTRDAHSRATTFLFSSAIMTCLLLSRQARWLGSEALP